MANPLTFPPTPNECLHGKGFLTCCGRGVVYAYRVAAARAGLVVEAREAARPRLPDSVALVAVEGDSPEARLRFWNIVLGEAHLNGD